VNGAILLLLCILLSAMASYFLKLGALATGTSGSPWAMVTNPAVALGALCYGLTFALYALSLQKVPLSLAQPVITAGTSLVAVIMAVVLLEERMATANWIGVLLVCLGVYFLFYGRA